MYHKISQASMKFTNCSILAVLLDRHVIKSLLRFGHNYNQRPTCVVLVPGGWLPIDQCTRGMIFKEGPKSFGETLLEVYRAHPLSRASINVQTLWIDEQFRNTDYFLLKFDTTMSPGQGGGWHDGHKGEAHGEVSADVLEVETPKELSSSRC